MRCGGMPKLAPSRRKAPRRPARIARVLGASQKGEGTLAGGGYVVHAYINDATGIAKHSRVTIAPDR